MKSELNCYLSGLHEAYSAYFDQLASDHPFKPGLDYLWNTGGKRVRPLLLLALLHDTDVVIPSCYNLALSFEFMHLASLLHDDLPALDNDDYRRGQLTVHRKFSEHTAILLADWMVGCAFYLLSSESSTAPFVSDCASLWMDISHGQELDMLGGVRGEGLAKIRKLKTNSFFCTIGTVVDRLLRSNDPFADTPYLITRWASDFGDVFQRVDDFLDREGGLKETGRKESSDLRNNKLTSYDGNSNLQHYRALKEELKTTLTSMHEKFAFSNTVAVLELAFARLAVNK